MNLIKKVQSIILRPAETWKEIKVEKTSIFDLYKSYTAVVLAAILAIASFVAESIIRFPLIIGIHVKIGFLTILSQPFYVLFYVLSLIALYVNALAVDALDRVLTLRINSFKDVILCKLRNGWLALP
jgi:hypothetical protein